MVKKFFLLLLNKFKTPYLVGYGVFLVGDILHKFYAFILSFLLVGMSTFGSYAQATTGNAAVDTVIRVQKSLFATVATGLAASAAIGLKAKELYDDNKQAVYDHALDAYDSMSDNARVSWSAAVARGKTGADMASDFWDSLTSVFADNSYSGDVGSGVNYNPVRSTENSVKWSLGKTVTLHFVRFDNYTVDRYTSTVQIDWGNDNGSGYPFADLYVEGQWFGITFPKGTSIVGAFSNDSLMSQMAYINANNTDHNKYLLQDAGIALPDDGAIYNPMTKRAIETDIPRMKDAGMVLPEVDVRTPSGTRVNYDAQAGTVTLPDGSIYSGDLVAGNVPDAIIKDGDTVWHDTKTNTDTNIWDGSVTDSITGDTVPDVGENAGTAEGEAGAVDAGDLPAETDIENVPSRGIVWTPLVQSAQDLTERFPFSIPWDLQRMLSIFNTDPETPKFDIDIKKYVEIDGKTMGMKWTLDFSFLDPLAAVGRWFLIIVFDIAMILAIRKIMPE